MLYICYPYILNQKELHILKKNNDYLLPMICKSENHYPYLMNYTCMCRITNEM